MGFFQDLFGIGGKKEERNPMDNMAWINKPPYKGERPYTGADVGYGAPQLKSLADQYLPSLMQKARGEGMVGFDPKWYETRKRQGLGDLAEVKRESDIKRSAHASGQGLRGGIPLSIQREADEDYGDTTGDFLDKLSIADLEARREDINKAFYQMPEEVTRGSGIQENRALFDLNEYNATMPLLYEYPQDESNPFSDILGMGGSFLGGGNSGSSGALAQAMQKLLGSSVNKSITPQKTVSDYRAEARRA